jgi:hypothetical protein
MPDIRILTIIRDAPNGSPTSAFRSEDPDNAGSR